MREPRVERAPQEERPPHALQVSLDIAHARAHRCGSGRTSRAFSISAMARRARAAGRRGRGWEKAQGSKGWWFMQMDKMEMDAEVSE